MSDEKELEEQEVPIQETAEDEPAGTEIPDSLEGELSALRKELEEIKSALQRERAEFMNYRKRTQTEKDMIRTIAAQQVLADLLPVFDSFDQIGIQDKTKQEDPVLKPFLEGAALIQRQLWSVFSHRGVEEISPDGEEFNPSFMEAISITESETATAEVVSQVFQKGYRIGEQVIRPARVSVTKPAILATTGEENE